MLGDDIDRTLAGLHQVAQRVFRSVEASRVANDEDGWIVVDDLRVGERSQVRAAPVLRSSAHEANGSRDDGGDQELVIEGRWPAVLVGINIDVLILQRCAAIVGTLTGLPVR